MSGNDSETSVNSNNHLLNNQSNSHQSNGIPIIDDSVEPSLIDVLFRNEWNIQFRSSRGLARHMFGGYFLGFSLSFGICLFVLSCFFNYNNNNENITLLTAMVPFSLYIIFSTICYTLEYTWHAMFHPETLDFDAFILYTHSRAFHIALVGALIEYFVEFLIFPKMKQFGIIHMFGLFVLIIGQIFRSMAQFTAGVHFTHLIATEKRESHKLVQRGVYNLSRHPSYFGWFWWSVGTQILLCNPISACAYALAGWNFFKERIPFEEAYLTRFFGNEYVEYKRRVPIGIPFMKQH